jgi:hypothetical protein
MAAFFRHHDGTPPSDLKAGRNGDIYHVEDVATRDSQIVTRGGASVTEPAEFKAPRDSNAMPGRPSLDRLIRRGK